MYLKNLPNGYLLQNPLPAHAAEMEALQRLIFPTLSEEEILTEAHFRKHIETFPEGQFIILDNGKIIGSASSFRCPFPGFQHTFLDITGNLWITTHDPQGEWMYGIDMGVEPTYRGQGLARWLYRARQETCKLLGMKGQVIAGMPNGYGYFVGKMPFEDYFEKVKSGEIFDPTLSVQMRMGFEPVLVIPNYLEDPKCGNYSVLLKLPVEREV